jgi:hypothetical protein
MSKNSKTTPTNAESFTINSAAAALGLSQMYVRRAVNLGQLKSHLVPINPEAKTMKHVITAEDLNEWRKTRIQRKRADGRGRFTLHATPEELKAIQELLGDSDLVKKQKVYKKKVAEPTTA